MICFFRKNVTHMQIFPKNVQGITFILTYILMNVTQKSCTFAAG